MNHGHILDNQPVLDINNFFRVRENRLEVCLVGICIGFSSYFKKYNPNIPVTNKTRLAWICNKIKEILDNSSVSCIVLDCRMENYFVIEIAKEIISNYNWHIYNYDILKLQKNQFIVLTATDPKEILSGYEYVVENTSFINWGGWFSNLLDRHIDWENIEVDMPIISLAGRPTEYRARFTKELLDLCGDRARMSFGNLLQFSITDKEKTLYSNILHPHPFPLMQHTDNKFLDRPSDIDDHAGYNLFQSVVNIVNETTDFDSNTTMLSEKTFKVFAWHQIPIFNASKGHVEIVRSLGFDMFDDIINHNYDTAPNIHIQKLKILNVVAKFLKDYPTLEDVNNLRKSIFHRLQANNELLYKLYEQRPYEPWPCYG